MGIKGINKASQGLFPLTFDWSMVAYNTNPLLSPHWAAANVFFGFVIFFWIITPALYYTNTWFTAYLPFCTAEVYDRFGSVYNATNVITGQSFDEAKYQAYSPPYLPATFAFVCKTHVKITEPKPAQRTLSDDLLLTEPHRFTASPSPPSPASYLTCTSSTGMSLCERSRELRSSTFTRG